MKTLITFLFGCLSCHGAFFQPWTDNGELIDTNHTSINIITNDITITLWSAKFAGSAGGRMISKPHQTGQFDFKDGGAGTVDWAVDNKAGGSALWRSTAVFNKTNVLTFWAVTFTYTDTNSIRIYSNGVVMTGSWINTPTNSAGTDGSFHMYIGSTSAGGRWLGYYSEVAVWNSILSPSQIQLIYNSRMKGVQKQINGSTLRAYLPLDTWPDSKQLVTATIYPDRAAFQYFPARILIDNAHNAFGMAERVCSYQPNE